MIALNKLIKYGLVIVVGLCLFYVLFAPGKFADSIRTTVSSIGSGLGIGVGTEELRTDYPEPSEGAVRAWENLVDLFQRHQHSSDAGCFIEYNSFADFGNCWIEIMGDIGWTKLQLICLDEHNQEYILSEIAGSPYKIGAFDFTPISVGGSIYDLQKSQNFYDNWITKKGIAPFILPEYTEVRSAVLKADEFFEGTLYANFPYLYKADKNHIGFVTFEDCVWWWRCAPCEKGLDEHCRSSLKEIAKKHICKLPPEVETQ